MSFLLALLAGCVVVSFVEYWFHRFQHWGLVKGDDHAEHHRHNEARGILRETWDYMKFGSLAALPIAGIWFYALGSWAAGGWLLGAYGSMFFSGWCHEVQHTNPRLVFWALPLHYFHHNFTPRHNFGFSFSVWDRLFGTFRPVKWPDEPVPWKDFAKVKWM